MKTRTISHAIEARVWLYKGNSPWHFITIEKEDADELKRFENFSRRGFGSIPVNVTVGKTKWKTSIFPDKNGTFVLPIKKEVRQKENIVVDKIVKVSLEVIR